MKERLSENTELREYEFISLEKIWRHYTGHLEKDGKSYFFKMAGSEEISPRTKNEASWDQETQNKLNINIPTIYETGDLDGLFWFIADYIDGEMLAKANEPDNSESLENNLGLIAKVCLEIMNLPTSGEPTDINKLREKLGSWTEKIDRDISDLVSFIEERSEFLQNAQSHGDFVPWHFKFDANNNLYLIDSEAANRNGIKFYDVCYFYHRVYTKMKRPDIAGKFLSEFTKIYEFSEKDKECFRLVMAQRLIGGYMDAQGDNITSIKLQDELTDKLFNNELV